MSLKEKCKVLEKTLLELDDNTKRKTKRNMLRNYDTLTLDVIKLVICLKHNLASKGVSISEDTLWFFMQLACANRFKSGSCQIGTAMNLLDRGETRFLSLLGQKDFQLDYSRKKLLREIMFFNTKEKNIDLADTIYDMFCWTKKERISQIKWMKQYYDLNEEEKENE